MLPLKVSVLGGASGCVPAGGLWVNRACLSCSKEVSGVISLKSMIRAGAGPAKHSMFLLCNPPAAGIVRALSMDSARTLPSIRLLDISLHPSNGWLEKKEAQKTIAQDPPVRPRPLARDSYEWGGVDSHWWLDFGFRGDIVFSPDSERDWLASYLMWADNMPLFLVIEFSALFVHVSTIQWPSCRDGEASRCFENEILMPQKFTL